MPELAEVAYYLKQWTPGLGQPVLRVHVNPTARVFKEAAAVAYPTALTGQKYASAATHGKNMLFRFGPTVWLGGHLGMTGEIRCEASDFIPTKHDHLVIFQRKQALVFRDPRKFGALRLHVGKAAPEWWSQLPIPVHAPEYTLAYVRAFFARHPKSPLKPLLLDQTGFPGIGNWMADEVLWRTKLHPSVPTGALTAKQQEKVYQTVREVCQQAMATIAVDWSDPPDSWLFNHRWKAGGSCPRCRTDLTRDSLRGRTACWCPQCQAVG